MRRALLLAVALATGCSVKYSESKALDARGSSSAGSTSTSTGSSGTTGSTGSTSGTSGSTSGGSSGSSGTTGSSQCAAPHALRWDSCVNLNMPSAIALAAFTSNQQQMLVGLDSVNAGDTRLQVFFLDGGAYLNVDVDAGFGTAFVAPLLPGGGLALVAHGLQNSESPMAIRVYTLPDLAERYRGESVDGIEAMTWLDFDQDGALELVAATVAGDRLLRDYPPQADGGLTELVSQLDLGYADALQTADLFGDNKQELLAVSDAPDGGVLLTVYSPTPIYSQLNASVGAAVGAQLGSLEVKDIDGDGIPDAIYIAPGSGIGYFHGLGGGAFEARQVPVPDPNYDGMALGDLDGDCLPDALGVDGSGNVEVALGQPDGGFGPYVEPPIQLCLGAGNPTGALLQDVDGDGRPDILLRAESGSTLVLRQKP